MVNKVVPLIDKQVKKRKKPTDNSRRMDETYIKINGKRIYLYRAVDACDHTIEFLLRKYRDVIAAKACFRKAFKYNGHLGKVTIDKSGSNIAVLRALNKELAEDKQIEVYQVKYLNNIVE